MTILSAASKVVAFKSGILVLAISVILALLTVPTFCLLGVAEPFSMPAAFLEKLGSGWSFEDEVESAIFEDRDFDGNDCAGLVLRLGVVLFAELHDIDAMLTKSWSDRGCRVCLTGLDLQLNFANNLLHGGFVLYNMRNL